LIKKNFIPFSLPDIDDSEIFEVVKTLRSGWLTSGPRVKRFEADFKKFINRPVKKKIINKPVEAIAVSSATAGLHLALEALGVKKGDEVIVPRASVVRYLGAEVKIVDIDKDTLNIDVKCIEKAISSKTKAIIPVHYAGLSCDMDQILKLAAKYNLSVVEDAAHALPTFYKGNKIGSLKSDATVFSFYANKTMTTGEGGMVVTCNPSLAKRIKVMRLHGIDRDVFNRFQSKKPSWFYQVIEPGFKYNMTDISAAIGINQLKKLPRFLKRRQYLAEKYIKSLHNLPLILPMGDTDYGLHSWHLFVIRLTNNSKINRNQLIQYLTNNNIGTSVHYIPLHKQPYWKKRYNLFDKKFHVADEAYKSMISLPLYTAMSDENQNRIIKLLHKAFI
jgi:dTDP-4-amino-4,6-dideoxygalactose transaminase